MDPMEQSFYERLMSTQEEMLSQLRFMQTTQQMATRQVLFESSSPTATATGEPFTAQVQRQSTFLDTPTPRPEADLMPFLDTPHPRQPDPMPHPYELERQRTEFQQEKQKMSDLFVKQPFEEWKDEILSDRYYLMGSEAMQERQTDIRQKMQLGTLNALNETVGTAAGVGAFLTPGGIIASSAIGLGAGAAVAYTADAMMDGARDALAYQRVLEEKGYKAFNVFEGRNDFGGIGMSLEQQQELSSFFRDLAPEKLLEDKEIAKILEGSLDGKLLKSTTDIKSFKKKFSEIVDSVKEVAVVMNSSLEEATKMLGELETRGISATRATMLSSQAKVNASLQGIGTDQALENQMTSADMLTAGSGMSAEKAMSETGLAQYVTSTLFEQYKEADSDRYHYIKNNGGEAVIAAKGANLIQNGLAQAQKDIMISQLGVAATFDEGGNLTLDPDMLARIERGELGDAVDIQQSSEQIYKNLTPGQQEEFVYNAPELFKQVATQAQQAAVTRNILEFMEEQGRTQESVVIDWGLAANVPEAQILIDQLYNTTAESAGEFAALSAREGLAAIERVNSPSFFAEFKAKWDQNVRNPLGDIGQFFSDEVGQVTLAFQKKAHGIGDTDGVRSDKLVAPEEFYERVYGAEDSFASSYEENLRTFFEVDTESPHRVETGTAWDNQRGAAQKRKQWNEQEGELTADRIERYMFESGTMSENGMTAEAFHSRMERAVDGDLTLVDLAELRTGIKDGTFTGDGKARAQALIDLSTGDKSFYDLDLNTLLDGKTVDLWGGDAVDELLNRKGTLKELESDMEDRAKKLAEDKHDALEQAYSAAQSLDLDPEQAQALHTAILSGDLEAAAQITRSDAVLDPLEEAQGYTEKLAEGRELSNSLSGILDNTTVRSDSVSMSVGLLVDSKAMSKKDAEILFADALGSAEKIQEGIDSKKWSVEKIQEETRKMDDRFKGAFYALSDEEVRKFAQSVADLNMEDAFTMESFLTEGGVIDREKVFTAVPNIAAASNVDGSKTIEASGLAKGLDDHKDAMGEVLETLTTETKMMKEAQKKLKNGNAYQYTSVM